MYIQSELEKLIPQYVSQLEQVDVSEYLDYEFSEKYLKNKKKIIRNRKKIYYPMIKTTGRRVASAIIAAVIMGCITSMFYAPAREALKGLFIKEYNDHSAVTTVDSISDSDIHKKRIKKEYNITVPKEFILSQEESVWTEGFICKFYYTKDNKKCIYFSQNIKELFSTNIDNEQAKLVKKHDKNGNEILVHNIGDHTVTIIWDDGEYIFDLSGDCSESELMEVYYSLK